MLHLASRIIDLCPAPDEHLWLLARLQQREFVPLIRSLRLSCYERALSGSQGVNELEESLAAHTMLQGQAAYVSGEIFCFEDHVLFLLFENPEAGSPAGMRAGIVYERGTTEPIRKLEYFCQTVSECLMESGRVESVESSAALEKSGQSSRSDWRPATLSDSKGFARFVAKQDIDALSTIVCKENATERVRASELLDDDYTRLFLRRAHEAYAEGLPINPATEDATFPSEYTMNRLTEVGLLRREVLVSCRKTGHTLFSLPSADALAVMTISNARCSECGAAIADERIEEVAAPTPLSSILLEDGAWMVNRLHTIIRQLGIPESEIVIEPPTGDGEARLLARVCGVPFLIVMRDGDLTPAFARRAVGTKIETDARHLVIVVTGAIHKESRLSLHNFANRMTRSGSDFELIIIQGMSTVREELRRSFEQASRQALAEQLCELNSNFGLDVAHFINTRFQLLHEMKETNRRALSPVSEEPAQALQKRAHSPSIVDHEIFGMSEVDETAALNP
ncbi:MAG: hypothetical protein JO360_16100 [Acidobacteria bacterium]|nr:hypothetical protein [Acidobacteriota bacterium]